MRVSLQGFGGALLEAAALLWTCGRVEEGRGGLRLGQSLRFPFPLIKPDVRISRIRLSDWLHGETFGAGFG
jgi:hypothetical protein